MGTIKNLYQTSQALFSASLLPQARWLTDGAYFSIFFLCTHAHIHLPCTHTLHTYWLADSCTCYWFVSLHYLIKILRLCGIPLCHIFCSRFISYKYNMITSALFLLVEQHKHIRGLYYEMGSELSLSFQYYRSRSVCTQIVPICWPYIQFTHRLYLNGLIFLYSQIEKHHWSCSWEQHLKLYFKD